MSPLPSSVSSNGLEKFVVPGVGVDRVVVPRDYLNSNNGSKAQLPWVPPWLVDRVKVFGLDQSLNVLFVLWSFKWKVMFQMTSGLLQSTLNLL